MNPEKDWEARFKASEIRPLPADFRTVIITCTPILGPWWVQILATVGLILCTRDPNHD